MTDTVNLGLPFIEAAQAQKHVTHNEALRILDALVMLAVKDRDLTSPPPAPAEGERYLVKATGSGAFSGKDNQIAHFSDGGWTFYPPQSGWTCYVEDESTLLAWNGEEWAAALDTLGGVTELQNMSLIGLGTEADAVNPFSAKLNNALWAARNVAEGGDGTLRYKLSKEDAGKTLSFLFQDNFSGRAEIGLTGDNDFHFKTSPDGSEWIDALSLDSSSGAAKINAGFFLAGDLSPSQIVSDQNDYNPSGLSGASVLRLSSDAARSITGLSGGGDGRVIALVNAGTGDIVLRDASGLSAAGNRFGFGSDITLASRQSAVLWYDATDTRWKLLSGPQAAGGGAGAGPADLDLLLGELALGLADALNVAQFFGSSGNRFADSFDTSTYIDVAGSTNLDTGSAGLIKPTSSGGSYGSDITAGATPTDNAGSSGSGGQAPGRAIDDNNTTVWPNASDLSSGCWWRANIASPKKVEKWTYRTGTSVNDAGRVTAVALQGTSNGGSSWTTVDTLTGPLSANTTYTRDQSNFSNATAFGDYRLLFTLSANANSFLAELEMMEMTAGTTANMTTRSTALAAAAAPSAVKAVVHAKFVDNAVPGTDFIVEASRDDGANWSEFTLTDRFAVNSIHVLESNVLGISGQPSGTSVRWRLRTLNNKMIEIHGLYLCWT